MRISELAARCNLPVSAVKYYQREGFIPAGERRAPNQIEYGEAHVRRVRLVRALLGTGGLSIMATKAVLAAVDEPSESMDTTFEVAQHAMSTPRVAESPPTEVARGRVVEVAARLGWSFSPDNPGIATAAGALDGLADIGFDAPQEYVDSYAHAAATAAAADMKALGSRRGRDAVAELMVVGTVLGDPLFAGFRRLAQQNSSTDFRPSPDLTGDPQ